MEIVLTYIHNIPIKKRFVKNLPYYSSLRERARALRKAGNYAEVAFWKEVHHGKFHNIDFDRQRIIGSYIVDFYVKALGLVIEIDGESHNEKVLYDERREAYLKAYGLQVYRVNDFNVLHDMENVLKGLEDFIKLHFAYEPPRPSGTPPREWKV